MRHLNARRAFFILAILLPASLYGGSNFGVEQLLKVRYLKEMEVAGNGAAVLKIQDYDGKKSFTNDLYLLKSSGELRRLTYNGSGNGSFAVSQDGTKVVFYGSKEGKQGLFILPLDGGESHILKELPFAAENVIWAGKDKGDGTGKILFTANVFPECGANFDCTKKKLDAAADGTSAIVADDLHFRPWNFWRNGTFSNLFAMDATSLEVKAIAVGRFDTPPVPFGGKNDIAVSPCGEYVAYAAKLSEHATSTNDDIFEIEIETGKTRKISESRGGDIAPNYSPDGRYIAFSGQEIAGFESDRWRLKIYDRKTGEIKSLTEGFDGWVLSHRWSGDGRKIFFVSEEKGYKPLYSIDVKSGEIKKLLDKVTIKTFSLFDSTKLLLTLETMQSPPDLYLFDIQSGKTRRLTALNEELLKGVEFGALEEYYYDGAELPGGKKRKIHTFVIKPPQYKKGEKYPLVVMIHGGPQGAWLNSFHLRWNGMVVASNGYVVALPNPTGSTGYGQDFVDAISKDWGGKCFEDIMALLDFTATLDFIDNDKVCAMGGSFGGYMTNWIAGKTDRFRCLISHAGVFNLVSKYGSTDELWFPEWDIGGTPWDNPENYKKFSPHEYVKNMKTPILFIHGQNDFRVPVEQALQGFTSLKRLGVETRLVYFPDEDHFINKPVNRKFWYDMVAEWLGRFLKKK